MIAQSRHRGIARVGQGFGCSSRALLSYTRISRRHFLAGAGALGAASVLPASAMRGQVGNGKVIDTHHHFYPPDYQKAWHDWEDARKIPHFANRVDWTREQAVEELDKNGVATSVLSIASTPDNWFGLGTAAAEAMARTCNDYGAEMVRDYKGRFGLFATLSMSHVDATLKEIEYVFDILRADGVSLQTNYGDRWLAYGLYKQVFEELNRRKAVVYVQPTVRYGQLGVDAFPKVIEAPHDTASTVTSLLLSGTLARLRDIKWLLSHAGGTIPMLAGHIDAFYNRQAQTAEPSFAPDGIEAEFRRLHYDTANASAPAMAALIKLVPTSQIIFGSDYPNFPLNQIETLRKMGLPAGDLQAIESGNAARLVPLVSV
jgi:predicted TIM-barrel fold metal-dependent hydrolase